MKGCMNVLCRYVFFFNDTATTEIYTLSLHDALPIYADLALYFGKTRGRGAFISYDRKMRLEMERRIAICAEVRGALQAVQVGPLYQHKIPQQTSALHGVEAPLPWEHPAGRRAPGSFLPALDDHHICLD